jgi:hypothetical protein
MKKTDRKNQDQAKNNGISWMTQDTWVLAQAAERMKHQTMKSAGVQCMEAEDPPEDPIRKWWEEENRPAQPLPTPEVVVDAASLQPKPIPNFQDIVRQQESASIS